MFMDADWGTRTMTPFGSMPGTIDSQSSPRIRIFRNGAFSSASRQSSSGCAPPTVPPRKSRASCGVPSRSSSGSSRRTKNRAWSSESAPRPECLLGDVAPDKAAKASYYRARYYDPQAGRFVSEDPLKFFGGDENYYRFVWNSSSNFRDPRGLWGVGASVGGSFFGGVPSNAGTGLSFSNSVGGVSFGDPNSPIGLSAPVAFNSYGGAAGGTRLGLSAVSWFLSS
jgi:RHS repeat-associated protein